MTVYGDEHVTALSLLSHDDGYAPRMAWLSASDVRSKVTSTSCGAKKVLVTGTVGADWSVGQGDAVTVVSTTCPAAVVDGGDVVVAESDADDAVVAGEVACDANVID